MPKGEVRTLTPNESLPEAAGFGLNTRVSEGPMARAMAIAPMYSMTYLAGIQELAGAAVASGLYGDLKPGQAMMILQTGLEMGIPPTVALRNIGSFKGKTTISSQLMLGLAKAAGYVEEITENTAKAASITIQKQGRKPYTVTFTWDDAVRAGYPDRNALYKTIPATMLLSRAIGLAVRYGAPEVGAGLYTNEEAMDITDDTTTDAAPLGGGHKTEDNPEIVRGWTLEAQEEFADLMDKLYSAFKTAGKLDKHPDEQEKWNKRRNELHTGEVLPHLRAHVKRLTDAATKAKPDKADAPKVVDARVVSSNSDPREAAWLDIRATLASQGKSMIEIEDILAGLKAQWDVLHPDDQHDHQLAWLREANGGGSE